jgi:hypothetical protein
MVVVIQVGGVVRGVVILLPVFEEQGNFSLAASPPNGEPGVSIDSFPHCCQQSCGTCSHDS